jgi:hypothetical protein
MELTMNITTNSDRASHRLKGSLNFNTKAKSTRPTAKKQFLTSTSIAMLV